MVNRLWNEIAPGNLHDATNPYNWEAVTPNSFKFPPGVPTPGDTLYMTGGIMNVVNGNLAGDTLNLSTSTPASLGFPNTNPATAVHAMPTVNLTHAIVSLVSTWNHDPAGTNIATVNVFGVDSVSYVGDSRASAVSNYITPIGTTFNVASNSTLFGSFATGMSDSITVNGPGKFAPSSVTVDDGGSAVINADVLGAGTISAGGYHPPSLTFGGAVGSGQTINLTAARLTIDSPKAFYATVNASTYRDSINLVGLFGADGWSLRNDMLNITAHGRSIDTLHLVAGSAAPTIGVYQTAAGVEVDLGFVSSASVAGTALHHVA